MSLHDRQATGRLGEDLACQALEHRGYRIMDRNWRCPEGEIDIVALDGESWAFVEVKTRHGTRRGRPDDALGEAKLLRLERLGQTYLTEHGLVQVPWRLDLVAIDLDRHNAVRSLRVVTGLHAS